MKNDIQSNVMDTQAGGQAQAQELTDGFNLLIDALQANDLNTIYGLVGIPVTDLARLAQARGMKFIGFRHEANAVNAAAIAGYMTQKPGVALTVSAPGFLNGLVALANATVNCFPMIMISGSSEREIVDLQQGDYEELDQLNAAKPYTKASYRINHAEDIGIAVARAIRAAVSGRPGGVYLDVPAQLLGQTIDAVRGKESIVKVVDAAPAHIPSPASIDRALDVLKSAKKPIIMLGKGAAYAQAEKQIKELIEKTGIPYLAMSMAKGVLPDSHPQSAMAARSMALKESDAVLLIGARLNWLLSHGKGSAWGGSADREFPPKKFVQIDISADEMDSNVPIDAPIVGDIVSSVEAMLAKIGPDFPKASTEWTSKLQSKREQNVAKMAAVLAKDTNPMNFHNALGTIGEVIKGRDIHLVNEGANALDYARSIIDMEKPRRRLDTGTWGVMGIGMGYAVGAAVESGGQVVAIEGDSAFGFSGMELETICRYDLPVCTIIMNNSGVYRGCDPNLNPNDKDDVPVTAFVKGSRYDMLIEAFGGKGYNVTTTAELKKALEEALELGKPTLINAVIDETAGTESGRLGSLNPQSSLTKK